MKQLFSLFLLVAAVNVFATIRTVSNNPSTIAQFNTIQAAISAAAAGDTIYVHGSPNVYAAFTLTNKQLVIIGPGWSPNKNLPLIAQVNGFTITGATSSNTEIQGLEITNAIVIQTNHPDNLRFIRNRFKIIDFSLGEPSVVYTGYLFEGNVFGGSVVRGNGASTYQNFLFQNNYFFNFSEGNSSVIGFTNSVNVVFNHNLFYGPPSGTRTVFSNNTRFLTITNNIFVRRDAGSENSFSTFNNNITFGAVNNTPWASNSNIDGGGNVANTDPQMVDQISVNAGVDNPLLDFTIALGAANNSGSDGKDMGLLYDVSGSLNWTNSRNSRLPFIFSMNIVNPTIATGGTLNIKVEARKSN
jgi:hypothetical protein